MQISDWNIVKHNVELHKALLQDFSDFGWDLLTFSKQLRRGVARDDRLKYFITDWWQDTTIVVHAKESIDFGEFVRVGPDQYPHLAVYHLKIYRTGLNAVYLCCQWLSK